jgi:DNA repair protein RadA/Sms
MLLALERCMARPKTWYECAQCGYRSPKWLGRCPDCSEWNAFVEVQPKPESAPERSIRARGRPGVEAGKPVPITQLSDDQVEARLGSGIGEFDRILGGGLVPGSVTLVGGSPGVGKSTLLMQVALGVAAAGRRVLYASGEESVVQVRDRAVRLGEVNDRLFLLAETDLDRILEGADRVEPAILIVDSVQTSYVPALGGTPGNVSQVREVAARLVLHAKSTGRAVLLVGHVTKGGQLAGPRTLEHVVDTVIYFEGDANPPYRVLRGEKNRFGATGELGLFEMTGKGLLEVPEPSKALLQDRPSDRPGTAVTCCLEGSRTLLLEVQGLVAPGFPGSTRRTALGVDGGRLAMLVAVLGKADFVLYDKDVFVNVAGGVRITEPAADLAVSAAVVSSLLGQPIGSDWLVIGEVGLTGELRSVPRLDQRLAEGLRHGFTSALIPKMPEQWSPPDGVRVTPAASLEEAMEVLL